MFATVDPQQDGDAVPDGPRAAQHGGLPARHQTLHPAQAGRHRGTRHHTQ
jgi:hypothetical protein